MELESSISQSRSSSWRCQVTIKMPSPSNSSTVGKSYTWTCSAFLKIILFTLTLTFTPSKAAHPRVGKNEAASKKSICYKGYGCFKNDPPFNPKMPLPLGEQQLGTKFLLRTRQHPTDFSITDKNTIANSTFNATRSTKILIHGFVLSSEEIAPWVPSMADTILANDDVNVIIVNWVKGAKTQYDQAVANTRMVGAQIHKLIMTLVKQHGAHASDFHLIGFSLGAHVAGFAGKRVRQSRRKLGRISGLDPANPAFNSDFAEVRLDRTDANFVDVIHTDIKTILHISSGMNRSIGHIDFWPNGGESQPGCHSWGSGFMQAFHNMAVCDHLRAPKLYMATITSPLDMIGYRCPNYNSFRRGTCLNCRGSIKKSNRCAKMGYWAEPPRGSRKNKQLDYYLDTSDKKPFAVRHYQVQIHWRKVEGQTTEDGQRVSLFIRLHGEKMSSESRKLYLYKDESTKYYHVYHNRTARFVVNLPYDQELGDLKRVTFWWQRQACWHYIGCRDDENIFVKRIRVLDGVEQKKYVFVTPERLEHEGVKPKEILPMDKVDFMALERRHHKHKGRKNSSKKVGDMVEPPLRQPIIVRRDTSSTSTQSNLSN